MTSGDGTVARLRFVPRRPLLPECLGASRPVPALPREIVPETLGGLGEGRDEAQDPLQVGLRFREQGRDGGEAVPSRTGSATTFRT
jgi:hypothetical protein